MAVKPKSEGDTFLREVDEELRRERVSDFVTRYGTWIIVGVVALLGAVGGWIWYQHNQNVQAGDLSSKVIQVSDQIERNNAAGAAATIDELVDSGNPAFRVAGLFARANAQISTNAVPAAIDTLKQIVADGDAPQAYRDAALIRQTLLEFETVPPEQVVERMRPFAESGNAWHGTAGELLAAAYIKQNKPQDAGRVFEAIARDEAVPDSIRQRAIQMASTLGIDAVQLDPQLEAVASGNTAAPQQ